MKNRAKESKKTVAVMIIAAKADQFGDPYWEVVIHGLKSEYLVATFYGHRCRQYAREHARRLNVLPEKDKP